MLVNQLDILRRAYKAAFADGFTEGSPLVWDQIATMIPSSSAINDYSWIGQMPSLREWIGERAVKSMVQHSYQLINKRFESTASVSQDDIDDNVAVDKAVMAKAMGMAARKHPDSLLAEAVLNGGSTVCYDEQYFFDTDHPVGAGTVSNDLSSGGGETPWYLLDLTKVLRPFIWQRRKEYQIKFMDGDMAEALWRRGSIEYGVDGRSVAGYGLWQTAVRSRATLDATGFDAAFAAMAAFESDEGRNLGCRPSALLYPTSLRAKALAVVQAQFLASGASNINYGAVKLIEFPELS